MFQRRLSLEQSMASRSVFLLGPRQTGKSTFLKKSYPNAKFIDLLHFKTFRQLSQAPETFSGIIELWHSTQEPNQHKIVVVDEVQKLPILLEQVHALIEMHPDLRFVLSGSSARKLRGGGTNLLGGRAHLYNIHPICSQELGSFPASEKTWEHLIKISGLPAILLGKSPELDLEAYTDLYLKEEIQSEGLARSLPEFHRFLTVASSFQGSQIIFEKVAAQVGLSGKIVKAWFQILEDTLIGHMLPSYKETVKRQPVASPKFYFFDIGLVRYLQGRMGAEAAILGADLESLIFQELICYRDYDRRGFEISYWRSRAQTEVDFVIKGKSKILAVEVKTSRNLSERDFLGLRLLHEEGIPMRRILVNPHCVSYRRSDGIDVLSVEDFLAALWGGALDI